jgi:hypothetical protein
MMLASLPKTDSSLTRRFSAMGYESAQLGDSVQWDKVPIATSADLTDCLRVMPAPAFRTEKFRPTDRPDGYGAGANRAIIIWPAFVCLI